MNDSTRTGLVFSELHKHPKLIAFTSTSPGKFALWLIATVLLWPTNQIFWISPLLACFLVRPQWRRELLCAGSICFLYQSLERQPSWDYTPIHLGIMLTTLLLIFAVYTWARDFQKLPARIKQRPLVCFHAFIWSLTIFAWIAPRYLDLWWQGFIVPFRWLLPFLAWRLSYLILSGKRGNVAGSGFLDHLWYCVPSFDGSNVPYGKGADYLNTNRADKPTDISRVQISGIKLLLLSKLWFFVEIVFSAIAYGKPGSFLESFLQGRSLGLAPMSQLIGSTPVSFYVSWGSLIAELFHFVITLAAAGHLIIGCLRLFGYSVFRNTYKPLLAETIIEFWNRLFYYFKELLVEFFFYPVFANYFKGSPKLRMFAAIMAAAFLGNIYYHFMRDFGDLGRLGPTAAIEQLLPRTFYAFLLGLGVFVSMQRQQANRGASSVSKSRNSIRRMRNIAVVWLFYSLIHIWNVGPVEMTFTDRTRFFFQLFGIG